MVPKKIVIQYPVLSPIGSCANSIRKVKTANVLTITILRNDRLANHPRYACMGILSTAQRIATTRIKTNRAGRRQANDIDHKNAEDLPRTLLIQFA